MQSLLKNLFLSSLVVGFFATSAQAQRGGQIGFGDPIGHRVGNYMGNVEAFSSALPSLGGNFRSTNNAIKQLRKWSPKLLDKLANHRNKYQIQGPLNLVNIWHKNLLISFYREAKGKNLQDIRPLMRRVENLMTNVRFAIVETYGLHIVL